MSILYISFYSLTSRTRIHTVELFVRKNLLLWWSFSVLEGTFYSLNNLKINIIGLNALSKQRSENLQKLRTIIIERPMRLQFIICHKKELFSLFFFYKTRANTQQVLPVQAGLYQYDE